MPTAVYIVPIGIVQMFNALLCKVGEKPLILHAIIFLYARISYRWAYNIPIGFYCVFRLICFFFFIYRYIISICFCFFLYRFYVPIYITARYRVPIGFSSTHSARLGFFRVRETYVHSRAHQTVTGLQ